MSRINETSGTGFGGVRRDGGSSPRVTYVQPGESTLAQVAQRLTMLEELLRMYNPQLNPTGLQTGQEVFLKRRFRAGQGGGQAGQAQVAQPSASAQERNFETMFEAAMRKAEFQQQTPFGDGMRTGQVSGPAVSTNPQRLTPAGPAPIPAYNPKVGPVITPAMWTSEMMTMPMTHELLANQVDPAAFINARKAMLNKPTDAQVVSLYNGSTTPLSPQAMATMEQAEGMRNYLVQQLGMSPTDLTDQSPVGAYRVEWGNDPRRLVGIGPLSVGALLARYATTPKELADQQTRDELRAAGLLKA